MAQDRDAAPPLNQGLDNQTLYAVYDLAISPITFDVLQFLQLAEIHRRHVGFGRLSVVFVLGPERRFRERTPKDLAVAYSDKFWRLRHIHMQACWLLPSCSGVQVFLDRAEAARLLGRVPPQHVFPPKYRLDEPKWSFLVANVVSYHKQSGRTPLVFRPTDAACQAVDRWIEANRLTRPIVALTLRNSIYEEDRNARFEEWLRFARRIDRDGYQPVFVPDTDQALVATPRDYQTEYPHFWQGPIDLELRVGLYDRSHICMSDNGAAAFIHHWMKDSHSVVFQPPSKVPQVFRKTGEGQSGMERVFGFKAGEQFPYCTPTQRLAWVEDIYDNILAEFRRLEDLIDQRIERQAMARSEALP